MGGKTLSSLLLVGVLCVFPACAQDDAAIEGLSCPSNQVAFESSCYEAVALQRSFLDAQSWCEQGGGHLAFIRNEETQQFLQKSLQPERDWWLGLAPASVNLTLDSSATEGPLSWLDGSDVSYSNWISEPAQGASCGYIAGESGCQWETASNCSRELSFICEFESGHSLACADHNATLQCGSGQVIEIDDSFYGRKTVHYCKSESVSLTSTQEECSWVEVLDSVAEQCHGLQACQTPADAASYGEPCPGLGSYLSVEYHCKDGLRLEVPTVAAVFDNITIAVKWLLHPFRGNLTCTLNAGDGHTIDPYSPEESDGRVVHKYKHAGMYTVGVECTTSEWHVTAQKSITIEEPMGEFGVLRCYSVNQSMSRTNCTALYGSPLNIQIELDTGTNVSYRIQEGDTVLASSSVTRGMIPHNVTLDGQGQTQLGPGCHQLSVLAMNKVTAVELSTALQLCLVEPLVGLEASVESEPGSCPDSLLHINVSLDQGAPAQLLIRVSGSNHSFSDTREMQNGSFQVFTIPSRIQGTVKVTVQAWNSLSTVDVDAGGVTVNCLNTSMHIQEDEEWLSMEEHVRVPRAASDITNSWKQTIIQQLSSTLTGPEVAVIYQQYADDINLELSDFWNSKKGIRIELREEFLNAMLLATNTFPLRNISEVHQVASAVEGLTSWDDELTENATLVAAYDLENFTLALIGMIPSNTEEMVWASTPIVEAVENVFEAYERTDIQFEIATILLNTLENVHTALLTLAQPDEGPITISTKLIRVYVNRLSSGNITKQNYSTLNETSTFNLPLTIADLLNPNEPVDFRMLDLRLDPFKSKGGDRIQSHVTSLSLNKKNTSLIPVENTPEEIEIFILSRDGEGVTSTPLPLLNISVVEFSLSTPNVSLVFKINSTDEIPIHLLLGFQHHPNDSHNEAEIQLPQEGNTLEEKYTWVLSPDNMDIREGVYYLQVTPTAPDGVAPNETMLFTSIATQCRYWDEAKFNWSDYGCRVGRLTTALATQCLCSHLTFFGTTFFVMPNTVDVSRSAALFATFFNNPVVVCFVCSIILAYLLVVIWAWRKDRQDRAKVTVTVLGDNFALAEYRYLLLISTGHRHGASTTSQVTATLIGSEGESEPHHLTDPKKPVFERGALDMFLLTTPFPLGELKGLRLWHDNSGESPAWFVGKVMVQDLETGEKWSILCNTWLATDVGESGLDKIFPVATEEDLKQFSNLFAMKTSKDFRDGHIWFSIISRPPTSNFTRVQRVSCCFSLLLCTMLTSIMFWGVPTDPSEQSMDLGAITFTWQQLLIGFQSSLLVFPINLIIVTIFRSVRPRKTKPKNPEKAKSDSAKKGKKWKKGKKGEKGHASENELPPPHVVQTKELTPDAVVKDIKRIAQALSKIIKIPSHRVELEPGRKTDINSLLTLVEEIILQQNRAGGKFYTDAAKKDKSLALSLEAMNLQGSGTHDGPTVQGSESERCGVRCLYLYRQLQHVEKELKLLGPLRFPNPDIYAQAVRQVQGMKGLLEPKLISCSMKDKLSDSSSPKEETKAGCKTCCQNGLPWWFVFVGWLLVLATSVVSAYFTMLYGLMYGKKKSIDWLISMAVSFFESLLFTQPLKVIGLAIFFALVMKKVDQDEFDSISVEEVVAKTGEIDRVHIARRDSTCRWYKPPPPCNLEKMRDTARKERKVLALIREITIYLGFLWMLLLVAHGQREPNAFYLNSHIRQRFTKGTNESMSTQHVLAWLNTTVLSNLFGPYAGFITDGNSKLVGNARLRQVRVQRNSCTIAPVMWRTVCDCHPAYSWDEEDLGSFGPGWSLCRANDTSNLLTPWQYQTQSKLMAHPIWGSLATYRGGGFAVDLGPDLQTSRSSLQYLFDNTWLDRYTQALFVEFTVYNANINLFCIVTFILEAAAVGAYQFRSELQDVRLYQSPGGFAIFIIVCQVLYFLFVLYYMFIQGKRMKKQKCAYFRNKWNLIELAIIILSWIALAVFITKTVLANQVIAYYKNHKEQFVSFYDAATADAVLGYLIAFLVLLATIKFWHLLRLNSKLHLITATLQRAWNDISGFALVLIITVLAYAIACNVLYGWRLHSYRTLIASLQSVICLQLGIFNYDEVLNFSPILGSFIIGSCIVLLTFVVLNLLISVILVAFNEEQKNHKPSDEEEIVDLMMMKICSCFGISYNKEESENSYKQNYPAAATTTPYTVS